MSSNLRICFDDLIIRQDEIIQYASKSCDRYSFISRLEKPYSKQPPNYQHKEIMKPLEPFLEHYVVGIKEWPGTITKENHKIMIVYRSCKRSRAIMRKLPNLFLPLENHCPEDVCFYRNNEPWLVTVSHEKMAFVCDVTEKDIAFFKENNIRFYE